MEQTPVEGRGRKQEWPARGGGHVAMQADDDLSRPHRLWSENGLWIPRCATWPGLPRPVEIYCFILLLLYFASNWRM